MEAIEKSAIVRITYKELTYECEFYLIWENNRRKQYVHGYKRSGGYLKNPDDHFANFILREIKSVEIIGCYKYPLERYRPKSKMFYKKIFEWRYKP